MNNKYIKTITQNISYLMIVGLSIILLFFVVATTWIGSDVKSQCQSAKAKYGGDCVEALVSTLKDDANSYRSRNSAIWALGQIGDNRALATLEDYYTGQIPEREPLNEVVSQYELQKAIKLVKGGNNITAVFWRRNIK